MSALPLVDVTVIGGGPAGAVAAMATARAGLRTLLVDHPDSSGVARVGESLPPAAKPLLRALGVWEQLSGDGHLSACGNESAWGQSQLLTTSFVRDPNGQGWHVDRARFDQRLRTRASESGAEIVVARATLIERRANGGWRLTLAREGEAEEVRTSWVIDCTGRCAWAARRCGAKRLVFDRQVAVVARYRLTGREETDRDATTLVEAAPHGWWYTSRVPDGRRIVAYLTDVSDATARQARTREGFADLLAGTRHIGARVAGYRAADEAPRIVAADTSRLDRMAGEGWLAAGDAAISFDPLAAQGILTAMYSGLLAGQAVGARLGHDGDAIGAYCARLDAIGRAFMQERRRYYQQERRWAGHRYWCRRAGGS